MTGVQTCALPIYYSKLYYDDATRELERFLKTYPNHIRKDYAHYLLGMSYYDQILSEKKDLGPIEEAKKNFEFVIKNYPNTDFALDSKFKLELIEDRKSTRLNSSHVVISYAVFCLKKKNNKKQQNNILQLTY